MGFIVGILEEFGSHGSHLLGSCYPGVDLILDPLALSLWFLDPISQLLVTIDNLEVKASKLFLVPSKVMVTYY